MHMAFAHARGGDANELRPLLQFGNGARPHIAHGGAKPPGELVQDIGNWPLVRHLPFNAFRHKLQTVFHFLLEITVRRAPRHGANRAHATIGFERPAIEQIRVARAFIGARQQRANHRNARPCGQCLRQIARLLDAAIGNDRHAGFGPFFGAFHDCRELRHADARHNPRRADGAGSNADLHGIGASPNQRLNRFARRHIARNDLHLVGKFLDAGNLVDHMNGVAVGRVHHDDVDACINKHLGPQESLLARARGRRHTQALLLVLGGKRMVRRLFHVIDGDEANAFIILIHHNEFLNPVLVQKALGFQPVNACLHRNQVARHQVGNLGVHVRGKAHVAVGDYPRQLAVFFHNRNAGNPVPLLELHHFGQGGIGLDRDRIDHHARFKALHLPHLLGLHIGLQVLVDDPEPARLGHGDGQLRFGHRIHGRRNDGNGQHDIAGNVRGR